MRTRITDRYVNYDDDIPSGSSSEARKRIAEDVEDYIKRGGKITVVPVRTAEEMVEECKKYGYAEKLRNISRERD